VSSPTTAKLNIEKHAGAARSQTLKPLPHEEIAKLAYVLWQQRGSPDGSASSPARSQRGWKSFLPDRY
jgi:hypothetical protein